MRTDSRTQMYELFAALDRVRRLEEAGILAKRASASSRSSRLLNKFIYIRRHILSSLIRLASWE